MHRWRDRFRLAGSQALRNRRGRISKVEVLAPAAQRQNPDAVIFEWHKAPWRRSGPSKQTDPRSPHFVDGDQKGQRNQRALGLWMGQAGPVEEADRYFLSGSKFC